MNPVYSSRLVWGSISLSHRVVWVLQVSEQQLQLVTTTPDSPSSAIVLFVSDWPAGLLNRCTMDYDGSIIGFHRSLIGKNKRSKRLKSWIIFSFHNSNLHNIRSKHDGNYGIVYIKTTRRRILRLKLLHLLTSNCCSRASGSYIQQVRPDTTHSALILGFSPRARYCHGKLSVRPSVCP